MKRFLNAQDAGVYELALNEIKTGRKQSHWMWYIFPQISGLGWSFLAQKYELVDFKEAKEYFENEILKERLLEISNAVYALNAKNISCVFHNPDDLKFKSCMTLFSLIAPEYAIFKMNLDRYYNGEMCEYTLEKFKKEIELL